MEMLQSIAEHVTICESTGGAPTGITAASDNIITVDLQIDPEVYRFIEESFGTITKGVLLL